MIKRERTTIMSGVDLLDRKLLQLHEILTEVGKGYKIVHAIKKTTRHRIPREQQSASFVPEQNASIRMPWDMNGLQRSFSELDPFTITKEM